MKVEPTGQHHLVLTGYETQGHRDSVSPNGLPPEHLEEIDTSKAEMRKVTGILSIILSIFC